MDKFDVTMMFVLMFSHILEQTLAETSHNIVNISAVRWICTHVCLSERYSAIYHPKMRVFKYWLE